VREGTESADLATKNDFDVLRLEFRAEIQSIKSLIEAAKSEMLGRMFQMIPGAVLLNIIAMLGVMFAFAKLLGH
jgi:hypothetical protein